MAQVTIYLPDALARDIRREARRARKSISAFLTDLARKSLGPSEWPPTFEQLYGSWAGEFPDVADSPPGGVASL